MSDDPRVHDLLEELLATGTTPEAVCSSCVELLPMVRERWQKVVHTRAELDALFPPESDTTSDPHDTLTGDMQLPEIPGYEVEAVLGTGGMGVVFKARHVRLNRVVALKMSLAGAYAGARERERFQREAESIAALKHPNIVQIHDVGDSQCRSYFTMEYVDGGSLAEKLVGTPLPVRDAAALLADLAAAVHVAHSCGIVHRDLKPGNILLATDGTPKISDFGLARRVDGKAGLTRTGTALGTASYMAPEQARCADGAVGPPVDLYALGAILYEMLTGRPPFRAESAAETMHQLLSQDPVPPSRLNGKVPRDLETICLKCLSKEPKHRYADADALGTDLQRFLLGEAIAARPEGRIRRVLRGVRRRPTLAVGIVAGVLLAALTLGGGSYLLFDRAVVDRAVASDLDEIDTLLRKGSFADAKAAIERAEARLGNRESAVVREQLQSRLRECELAERLERISLNAAAVIDGMSSFTQADSDFNEAIRSSGFGQVGDDPDAVAARIRESRICSTLLAALDRWSVVSRVKDRTKWILTVANAAEPDRTPWRADARNPDLRGKRDDVFDLMNRADVRKESVALLLAIRSPLFLQESERQLPYLRKVQAEHPDDLWANIYLGYALLTAKKPEEAVRYFQTVVALRPDLTVGYFSLGTAFHSSAVARRHPEHFDESITQFRKVLEIEPNSGNGNFALLDVLVAVKRHPEIISQAEKCLQINHKVALVRARMGTALKATGRVEESFKQFELAYSLEPGDRTVVNEYRAALLQERRWDDLKPIWAKMLKDGTTHHEDWYGYAEMCLYSGKEDEYRIARQALLDRFANTDSPFTAERASRAYLLLPATGKDQGRAVALAELAAKVDQKRAGVFYPYFQFAKGLAEYRQGHFENAIVIMRGDASRMNGPLPQLVLAMSLHQAHKTAEARRTFSSAMLNHDWREIQVNSPDGWIRHVLRREAEKLIYPSLPMLLDQREEPRSVDERLALIGVCRFENRFATLARVYSESFAADPRLAEAHRSAAARVAVQAGCGRGTDAATPGQAEKAKWRAQARIWLHEELTAMTALLSRDFSSTKERARQALSSWKNEPELAAIRDPDELAKLSVSEQSDCRRLWAEVGALLGSASK